MTDKIKIAVSRCLLGEQVRYDGTDKACKEVISLDTKYYEIIPFCPEVETGMGVPRLPIQLDLVDGQVRVRQKIDKRVDVTENLIDYASKFAARYPDLSVVINKKASPSCGHNSTKLFENGELISTTNSGAFILRLKQCLPNLKIYDEEQVTEEMLNGLCSRL